MHKTCLTWHGRTSSRSGIALVLVLAFIVLLTFAIVAFFSRATDNRQISFASANHNKVESFALGAINTVVGDLKQEIVEGSHSPAYNAGPANAPLSLYIPKTNLNAVPAYAGFAPTFDAPGVENDGLNNLLKVSVAATKFYPTQAASRIAVDPKDKTTATSQNGHYISLSRWNKPLLMPVATGVSDLTPKSTFPTPSWVLVARDGTNPTAWSTNMIGAPSDAAATTPVTGRFAYAIYDEGGLLDANVAGSLSANNVPTPPPSGQGSAANKKSVAYADLSQIPNFSDNLAKTLVGWRNYATAAVNNQAATPTVTALGGQFPSYTWDVVNWTNYFNNIGGVSTGFLRPANTQVVNSQTDRRFTSRQQLINFILNSDPSATPAALQGVMQYLGTFSRDLEQPSYLPPESGVDATKDPNYMSGAPVVKSDTGRNTAVGSDGLINPAFVATRVQTAFTRNDGSLAAVGEPLMKNRFALNRLAWLTYLGPISDGNGSGATVNSNSAIQKYAQFLHDSYGLSWPFLQQGTAANVYAYFGLSWVPDIRGNGDKQLKWYYSHRSTQPLIIMPGAGLNAGPIMRVGRPLSVGTAAATTYVEDANREPDFFEILKASVAAGSKAAPSTLSTDSSTNNYANTPAYYQSRLDRSLEYAVIQLGANIIDQFDLDGYPTHIVFDDGSLPPRQLDGIENLPYLYQVEFAAIQGRKPVVTPGHSFEGNNGNGTTGSTYSSSPLGIIDPGYDVAMYQPVVWNPHDQNCPLQNPVLYPLTLYPKDFRFVMNSVNPDSIGIGGGDITQQLTFSGRTFSASGLSNQTPMNVEKLPTGTKPFAASDVPSGSFPITPANSALSFSTPVTTTANDNVTTSNVFREPTLLSSASASALTKINLQITATKSVFTAPKASAIPNNHPDLSAVTPAPNALGVPAAIDGGNRYAGVYAASFPAQFYGRKASYPTAYNLPCVTYTLGLKLGCTSMTYRLQYQDPNPGDSPASDAANSDDSAHAWSTYDVKYADGFSPDTIWTFSGTSPDLGSQLLSYSGGLFGALSVLTGFDPRTSRFGLGLTTNSDDKVISTTNSTVPTPKLPTMSSTTSAGNLLVGGFNDYASGTLLSLRPDFSGGFRTHADIGVTAASANTVGASEAPRTDNWSSNILPISAGMTEQNILSFSNQKYDSHRWSAITTNTPNSDSGAASALPPQYFTDPDGIVRRGMGAYAPISGISTLGLPMATAARYTNFVPSAVTSGGILQSGSRPVVLNRPFANVGELSHVFSGTPWRNVDFSTPESGDAALLDVFCINNTDDPNALVAGKVNLNTRQVSVLAAVLAGTSQDTMNLDAYKTTAVRALTASQATNVATALVAWTTNTTTPGAGPLANVSELVGKYTGSNGRFGTPYAGFGDNLSVDTNTKNDFTAGTPLGTVQRFRDSAIRSLGSVGTTRVWNLMIDVVAQTGRYPYTARGINEFYVEAEQRYWVHLAIDRYTGQVLDRNVELVKE